MKEESNLKIILAKNIKNARKKLNITQIKLAEYTDLSEPYMNDIEGGKTWISEGTLIKISNVLHKEPWQLLVPYSAEDVLNDTSAEYKKESENDDIELISKIKKVKENLSKNVDTETEKLLLYLFTRKE